MSVARLTTRQAERRQILPALGFAALALLGGLLVGVAVGLGTSTNLLLAGVVGPFALLGAFIWPAWATPVYMVLVYADLLSILVRYHGMPPLARFAGFVILVAVVGRRLVKREGLVGDPMTWWLSAYGVVLSLGLFYAQSPNAVATELVEFVRNFITYIVVINTLTTVGRVRVALWGLLAMGAVLAALTIYQTVTGNFDSDFGGLAQSKVTGITELIDAPRPGGTLGDANFYGQSLLIIIPVAFFLASRSKGIITRFAGVLTGGLLVAAVVFTYSRGDTVALAAILLAAIMYKRPPLHFILGGLVALGMIFTFLPSTYYERLGSLFNVLSGDKQAIIAESSLLGRAGAASAAIDMFIDYPILGVGRGNYPLHELDYIEGTSLASKSSGIPPHDLYLEVAAEQGVVGILVMGGILFTAFAALVKARQAFLAVEDSAHAELVVWLGIALVGYLVSSLFLHGAYLYILWLQVSVIVALFHAAQTAKLNRMLRNTANPGRAIRVRELRPPGPAEVLRGVAQVLPSARERPVRGARRLVAGIFFVLAAASLLGLASIYALPRQDTSDQAQGGGAPAGAGLVLPAPLQTATPGAGTPRVTGYSVSPLFLSFWQSHGGLPVFGYPIGPEMFEAAPGDRLLRVQYFERARLEYHPESTDPSHVEAGRLGDEVAHTGQVAATATLPAGLAGVPVVLAPGKPSVPSLFAAFWLKTGEPVLGYPTTPVMVETVPGREQLYVQYFERARLEYHPENDTGQQVVISRLGAQVYEGRYGRK